MKQPRIGNYDTETLTSLTRDLKYFRYYPFVGKWDQRDYFEAAVRVSQGHPHESFLPALLDVKARYPEFLINFTWREDLRAFRVECYNGLDAFGDLRGEQFAQVREIERDLLVLAKNLGGQLSEPLVALDEAFIP